MNGNATHVILQNFASECSELASKLNSDVLCQNVTLWKNQTCIAFGSERCTGNYPGQCFLSLCKYVTGLL